MDIFNQEPGRSTKTFPIIYSSLALIAQETEEIGAPLPWTGANSLEEDSSVATAKPAPFSRERIFDLGYIQRTVWSLLQGNTIPLSARTTYPTSFDTVELCDGIAQLVTEQAGTIKMVKGAILKSYSACMNLKLKLKELTDVARSFGWSEKDELLSEWLFAQLAKALDQDKSFFRELDRYLDGDELVAHTAEGANRVPLPPYLCRSCGHRQQHEDFGCAKCGGRGVIFKTAHDTAATGEQAEDNLTLQEQKQVEISNAFMVLETLAEEAEDEILVEALADLQLLWNVAALPEPGLAKTASGVRKMLGEFLQAEDPDLRRAEACLYDTALLQLRANKLLPGKEAATLPTEDERRKKVSDFVRSLLRKA